jgi:hypothetical protein
MEPSEVECAVESGSSTASALGLRVDDAVVVHFSNRVVVRLTPGDVLAVGPCQIGPTIRSCIVRKQFYSAARAEASSSWLRPVPLGRRRLCPSAMSSTVAVLWSAERVSRSTRARRYDRQSRDLA